MNRTNGCWLFYALKKIQKKPQNQFLIFYFKLVNHRLNDFHKLHSEPHYPDIHLALYSKNTNIPLNPPSKGEFFSFKIRF